EYHELCAIRISKNGIDNLIGSLSFDAAPGRWAVGNARPSINEPKKVVNLGRRRERASRSDASDLLADADGRWQALDAVNVGSLELFYEGARVSRDAFEIASLPLRMKGVVDQGTFAAAADSRHHDELIAGD